MPVTSINWLVVSIPPKNISQIGNPSQTGVAAAVVVVVVGVFFSLKSPQRKHIHLFGSGRSFPMTMLHQMAKNLGLSNLHMYRLLCIDPVLSKVRHRNSQGLRGIHVPLKHLQKTGELCHYFSSPEGDFLKQPEKSRSSSSQTPGDFAFQKSYHTGMSCRYFVHGL